MGLKLSLRGGINFDIITGFDCMNKAEVIFLWEYLHKRKPRCVVMAPPCTAFCQWSQRNRLNAASRPAWLRSRIVGMRLSRLVPSSPTSRWSMVASSLSKPLRQRDVAAAFLEIHLDMQGIYAVKVQMCAAGLKDPLDPEFYIQKGTWIVANNKLLSLIHI